MIWVYAGAFCLGMAALYWYLAQITRRQREVRAELHRLEQLTAQLTVQAEAVLDRADERIMALERLLETEPAPVRSGPLAETLKGAEGAKPYRGQAQTQADGSSSGVSSYQALSEQARRLAAEGFVSSQIAKKLKIPRGEVELLLQLPNRQ